MAVIAGGVTISFGAWIVTTKATIPARRIGAAVIVPMKIVALNNADFEVIMTGNYTMDAIPPYCGKIVRRVRVLKWMGDRVLLEELENPNYLIDTALDSFEPDIPSED